MKLCLLSIETFERLLLTRMSSVPVSRDRFVIRDICPCLRFAYLFIATTFIHISFEWNESLHMRGAHSGTIQFTAGRGGVVMVCEPATEVSFTHEAIGV